MANSYDYFKQQVAQMENIRAQTAHEQHIVEFRAMCAKMINDAIPDIKQNCKQEIMQEIEAKQRRDQEREQRRTTRTEDVNVRINIEDIKKKIVDAFNKAFR